MQTEIEGLGFWACLFVFNSDLFLFFIFISATEADSQDSGTVHEPGQPSSSPEKNSRDQSDSKQ